MKDGMIVIASVQTRSQYRQQDNFNKAVTQTLMKEDSSQNNANKSVENKSSDNQSRNKSDVIANNKSTLKVQ